MSKLVPVILKLDSAQARQSIRAINKELSNLGGKKIPIGFSPAQLKRFEQNIKNQSKLLQTHAKQQAQVSIQEAKRITQTKQSELKRIENLERSHSRRIENEQKSRLRSSEKAAADARKLVVKEKEIEARKFQQVERKKLEMFKIQSRERIQAANREARQIENQKKREWQEFQRAERAKTQMAAAEARKRGKLHENIQNAGNSIRNVGVATTAAVTFPIVAGLKKVIELGTEYEDAMNVFQANTEATADQMDRAAKIAIKLGNDITLPGVSAKDAANAMNELAKGGLKVEDAISAAEGTLRLSKAANLDAAESAKIVANALNIFALEGKEANRVADLLAASASSSSGTVQDMAEAFKNAGPIFKSANQTIDDTTTAIALLAKAGITGGDAGTGLKNIILALAAPSSAASKAINKMGLEVFDSAGNMKPFGTLIEEINDKIKDYTQEQKLATLETIFGRIGIKAILPILDQGKKGWDDMRIAVTRAGAAQKLAEARTKGVAGAWDAFISQLETLGLIIFNAIKDDLKSLILAVAEFASKFIDAFIKLPKSAQQAAVAIALIAASIGPLLIIVGTLVTAFGAFAAAVGALGGFAVVIPIIAAVGAAIAVLSASILAAIQTVFSLSDAWNSTWGPIASVVAVSVGIIMTALNPIFGLPILFAAIVTTIYKVWETNFGGIRDFTRDVFNGIKDLVNQAMSAIRSFVDEILVDIKTFWEQNGNDIKSIADSVYKSIYESVEFYLTQIREFWDKHGDRILAIIKAAWEIIKSVIKNTVKIIGNLIKLGVAIWNKDWSKAWEAIIDITSAAVDMVATIVQRVIEIVANVIISILTELINARLQVERKAFEIGESLVTGLYDGIMSKKDNVLSLAGGLITQTLGIMKITGVIKSPSRETFKIGEFLGEGLAQGIRSKFNKVKIESKKLIDGSIKTLKESLNELNQLSGLSANDVKVIQANEDIQDQIKSLQEILKLRRELGLNQDTDLPNSVSSIQSERKELEGIKQIVNEIKEAEQAAYDLEVRREEQVSKDIERAIQQGRFNLLNIKEEIQLLRIIDPVEKERIKNHFDLLRLREEMLNDGFSDAQIKQIEKVQSAENEAYLAQLEILQKRKEIKEAEDFALDLEKQIRSLTTVNDELTVYEETLSKIDTDFKNISTGQKEYLLDLASQVDLLRQMREEYDELKGSIKDILSFALEGDFKGLIESAGDKIKSVFLDNVSSFITTSILGFDPNSTDNAVAKPIVKEISTSNNILKNIDRNIARASGGQQSSSGFGGIGQILSTVFGLGSGNLGSSGSSSSTVRHEGAHAGSQLENIFGTIGSLGTQGTGSSGNIIGGLKDIFSGKDGTLFGKGGIFGKDGFGNNVGTFGAIGSIAGLVGGLIGGKAGSVISSTGSGIAIGASIGSIVPGIGTAIGAVVGGIVGFFSSIFGSSKRKNDKNENLPRLEQGFTEAISQLREIANNKNAILSDPFGAIQKAESIRDEIKNGFGIRFESKKYRKIASQKIQQKTNEADVLVNQIKEFAEKAKAANETDNRLVAQFATGVYMGSKFKDQYNGFKRRNGLLPGNFSRGDVMPSLLAGEEMVLNKVQQFAVIKNAGGIDPFEDAGIPGYDTGRAPILPSPKPLGNNNTSRSGNTNVVEIYLDVNNQGIVESDIDTRIEGKLDDNDVQVKIYKKQQKLKIYNRDV